MIDEGDGAEGDATEYADSDFSSVYCITEDGIIAVERDPGPIPIPKCYSQAVSDPVYGEKWREAMTEDYNGKYLDLKAWQLVAEIPKAKGHRRIKGKWVFAVKYHPDGSVLRFKAHYVGCGLNQVQGRDYVSSFSSTLRLESLRAFMASACLAGDGLTLTLLEVDVVKAVPSGDMDDSQVYVYVA